MRTESIQLLLFGLLRREFYCAGLVVQAGGKDVLQLPSDMYIVWIAVHVRTWPIVHSCALGVA